ncbi:GntR family transcriptional regulator [Mycolicibacterium palauense]|uniref:GntR family transcriptional regulator n=1 Tax=Mycolicibacterium palauense TaxID=2034511 RepID=UPI000BFEB46C|nr:GntR family transcriptional regulator [Mycolicibacterium palauense]
MSTADQSSSERVYRQTKERILSGDARGGELLSEVEVATALGVSRTPVHEAFLRLAAEDLLHLMPRRGAVVVPPTVGEAVDLLEMRVALETAAVRRVLRSPDSVGRLVGELEALLDEQRSGASSGDLRQYAAADDAFHRHIVEIAGNSIGQRFYCSLSDRQRRMLAGAVEADPGQVARLIDEHARLISAIARRDTGLFEAELLRHLEATYRVTLT